MPDSKIKIFFLKLFLIGASFLVSFIFVELIINNIIGFPRCEGRNKYILNMKLPGYEYLNWKKPGYKPWTVEDGIRAFELNNLGFPGTNVKTDNSSRDIFLLGDSFLEGEQYPGDKIASDIFQKKLLQIDSNIRVLNLSSSGHDPYILWFRAHFFEKYFNPEYTFLIIESFERLEHYLNRFKNNYDFNIPDNLGVFINDSFVIKVVNLIRKYSAFANLVTEAYFIHKDNVEHLSADTIQKNIKNNNQATDTLPVLFKECLINYRLKYKDKFILISLDPDTVKNNCLKNYCFLNKINFCQNNKIMIPENLIDGNGHFNLQGNLLLGQYLYDVYNKISSGKY